MGKRGSFDFTITIDRAPDEVFAYLRDVSKHAEWSPKPFHVEGSTGPVQTGDTFTSFGVIPGDKNHRNEVTVAECTANRLVLDSIEKDEHFFNTFAVEADGAGTKVTRTVDAPKPGFPLSLMFPLILAFIVRPDVNKGLAKLKANLEAR